MNNRNRSILAEYLVGAALDAIDTPRVEWDNFDLTYKGVGIEVKSAAYLQSWRQDKPSDIRFDIKPTYQWDHNTNRMGTEQVRSAAAYVFCLFAERDPNRANVFDVAQWQFFVLATSTIDRTFGSQKSVGIARLCDLCEPTSYTDLRLTVDVALR